MRSICSTSNLASTTRQSARAPCLGSELQGLAEPRPEPWRSRGAEVDLCEQIERAFDVGMPFPQHFTLDRHHRLGLSPLPPQVSRRRKVAGATLMWIALLETIESRGCQPRIIRCHGPGQVVRSGLGIPTSRPPSSRGQSSDDPGRKGKLLRMVDTFQSVGDRII